MFKYPDSPAIWFLGTWIIAWSFWFLAPDFVVYSLVPHGRYISFAALLYFLLFMVLFLLGFRQGYHKRVHRRFPFSLRSVMGNRSHAAILATVALKISYIFIAISLLATIIHIFFLYSSLGSLGLNVEEITSDDLMKVRLGYREAVVQGLTIFKWINLPAFNLCLVIYFLTKKFNLTSIKKRTYLVLFISLLVPGLAFVTGSRSTSIVYLICFAYIKLSFNIHLKDKKTNPKILLKRKKMWKKLIIAGVLLGIIIFLLFTAGQYIRSYARIESGKLKASSAGVGITDISGMSSYEFSLYVLSSYFFRCINNGLLLVDHLDTHTYTWRLFRWAYTGFGLEQKDPGGLIHSVRSTMVALQNRGLGFFSCSNSSFPGYMFIDLGWFALILFFFFGYIVGNLYRSMLQGRLLSWIILPIVIFAIMESWQNDIMFRSMLMLPIIAGVFMNFLIKRKLLAPLRYNTFAHVIVKS